MKTGIPITLVTALLCAAATAFGQNITVNYEGRVAVGGANFTGAGQFKFALVTSTPPPATIVYTSYWSNDGTSVDGSEPSAAVNVSVVDGLFIVGLGDTTLANMTALSAGLFSRPDLQLRIWFNDGVSGFAVLSPVQNLAFVPYAAFAHSASNLLGTLPSANLSGPYSGAVSFNNPANSFSGSGAGLTGLNASQLTSGTVPAGALANAWRIDGNAGTTPGTHFLGTTDGQALELRVNNLRALRLEPNSISPNVIGGFNDNFIGAGYIGSTIGGGGSLDSSNAIYASFATIAGGWNNDIGTNSDASAIGGGRINSIAANSLYATIAGGLFNDIGTNSDASAIGGGFANNIAADSFSATIAGGSANDIGANSDYSAIGGGRDNNIAANSLYATIAGGYLNNIAADSFSSAIGGGTNNNIGANSEASAIGGGRENNIAADSPGATIAGGGGNDIGVNSFYSAIGGGWENNIAFNAFYATIAGGFANDISTNSSSSAVGGGEDNDIAANSFYATIAGGYLNDIGTDSWYSAIGAGRNNNIAANSWSATIAGGDANDIRTNSSYSAIGGGLDNNIAANAQYATIPGGERNFATNRAFAAGTRAKANHTGAFVWADSNDFDFASTAPNKVRFRCTSGFDIITAIDGSGVQNAGVFLAPGDSAWSVISDRARKENFQPVNPREVLEKVASLPMSRWNYKSSPGWEHLGPMAQDFHAAFGLGPDHKSISTVDADGVALAAIQGLHQMVKEKDAEIQELKGRLEKLERLLESQQNR